MAIRKIGGEMGKPLVCACNVVATHQDEIAVGQLVQFSSSSNWAVNSTAAATAMNLLGRVEWLNPENTVAVVKWYGWNKAFENTYSAAATLGYFPVADTSGKTKASGNAAASLRLATIVASDFPATGKCQWVSV